MDEGSGRPEGEFLRPGGALQGRLWQELSRDLAFAALPTPGERLGAYRLLRRIGEGGMGEVFLAERADGRFEQRVALKVLRPGLASAATADRFEQERRILATLDHPNIARVVDGGETVDRRPYLVMELVEGLPIDRYCAQRRSSLEERLRLFIAVGEAVQHAHGRLVVHRDIKPSNVLVSEDGRPRLVDFGIAKLLDDTRPGAALPPTRTGLRALTPEYASPEQLRGAPVTTASDIYQLGHLLFELLTGRRPYASWSTTPAELERAICEQDPPAPSSMVDGSRRTDAPQMPAAGERRLHRRLRGDLDAIVLMALRKEPERRYASVAELVEDVRRYLSGLPVRAQRDSRLYRARRFVGRHPLGLAAGLLIALLVVAYGLTTTLQLRQIRAERERARVEAQRAKAVRDYVAELFRSAGPWESGSVHVPAVELLERGAERLEHELRDEPGIRSEIQTIIGRALTDLGDHERARALLEGALATEEASQDPDRRALAQALRAIGHLEWRAGSYPEAQTHLERAVAILERSDDELELAEALRSLGLVQHWRGEYEQARATLETAADRAAGQLGPEHAMFAGYLDALALPLFETGANERALETRRRALEIYERALGPEHPRVGVTLNNLGIIYERQRDYESALPLFERALAIFRKALGPDHPFLGQTLEGFANALRRHGRYQEAKEHLNEARRIIVAALGPIHRDVATNLNTLANVHNDMGEYEAAEPLYLEAIRIYRQSLGDGHAYIAYPLTNLGNLFRGTGDVDRAREHYEAALALRVKALGEGHPLVEDTRRRISELENRATDR